MSERLIFSLNTEVNFSSLIDSALIRIDVHAPNRFPHNSWACSRLQNNLGVDLNLSQYNSSESRILFVSKGIPLSQLAKFLAVSRPGNSGTQRFVNAS